jgi:hypothetical protein
VSLGLAGRATAMAGIICGLLAIGLKAIDASGFSARYVDDGTAAAFLLITLAMASHFPAEIGSDARAAAIGCAAFGFLLFWPAQLAFDNLGSLGAAGWLGVFTGLIPLGYAMVKLNEGGHDPQGRPRLESRDQNLSLLGSGLVLIVIGIWLDAPDGGPSYWNLSHTLGLLMLLLVALNVLLAARAPASSDAALLVAATTFGLVEFWWIAAAFEDFGTLGPGAWMEAFGGLFLLVGVVLARRAAGALGAASAAPAQ